jgi:hypothetical protein
MVRARRLSALVVLLSFGSAWAQPQQSVEEQTKQAVMHAAFYLRANGRTAEAACYMRQAQGFGFDPRSAIKHYYETIGFDDPRMVLLRAVHWWAVSKDDAKLTPVVGAADAVALSITKQQWPAAIDDAKHVAEAVKAAYGQNDLRYADYLSIVADLQALSHDFAAAAGTLEQVLAIRQSARPSDDAPPVDPRNKVSVRLDLARTMSKLADTYWILGQDQLAAKLRSDPRTRAGDGYRISDIEYFVDRKVPDRTPLLPDHPSCVASVGIH